MVTRRFFGFLIHCKKVEGKSPSLQFMSTPQIKPSRCRFSYLKNTTHGQINPQHRYIGKHVSFVIRFAILNLLLRRTNSMVYSESRDPERRFLINYKLRPLIQSLVFPKRRKAVENRPLWASFPQHNGG